MAHKKNLDKLPYDMVYIILFFLEPLSLLSCLLTNKSLKTDCEFATGIILNTLDKNKFCFGYRSPKELYYHLCFSRIFILGKKTTNFDFNTMSSRHVVPINILDMASNCFNYAVWKKYIFMSSSESRDVNTIFICDTCTSEQFTIQLPLKNNIKAMTVSVFQNNLILSGGILHHLGYPDPISQNTIYKIQLSDIPLTNLTNWTKMPDFNIRRVGHSAKEKDGLFFICGGCNDNGYRIQSVEVFNPKLDTWTIYPNMCRPRREPKLHIYNGELYASGGECIPDFTIEKMNNITREWRIIASICNTEFHSVLAILNKITILRYSYTRTGLKWDSFDLDELRWIESDNCLIPEQIRGEYHYESFPRIVYDGL